MSEQAERALLATILTGTPAIDDVAGMLTADDFYQPRNGAVWDACLTVHKAGDRIDPVTLPVPAKARPYVVELVAEGMGTAGNATAYAAEVRDGALRRRLREAHTRGLQLAADHPSATDAAAESERLVAEAAAHADTREGGTTLGEGIDAAIDWLETPPVGAETPWVDVNRKTNGLLAGSMITVAARPGHGKSLVAKDVGLYTAQCGKPVHIATLEMSRNEYMARILCGLSRVDLGAMLRRELGDDQWARIGTAAEKVRGLPLYLDDRPGQSMAQIRAAARQTQRRYGGELGLIAIDYAQLVRPANDRLPRQEQVAQISRDTKLLAKEFHCPVLLLAQLNRKSTERSDHTPVVSDLRESGALEQDSDQVWLLHREDQYDDAAPPGVMELIVGKNRNGPAPSTIPLSFQGHYAQVASLV